MEKPFDSPDVAGRYDSARSLPSETLALWMDALKASLPPLAIRKVLDLGCGTGRFTAALAEALGCPVVGVDPSSAMLDQARRLHSGPIEWVQGSAETIPLPAECAELVWMSVVYHHLEDKPRSFQEVRRVLCQNGCLAVRNDTQENNEQMPWPRFFPEVKEFNDARLPSRSELIGTVTERGFTMLCRRTVSQRFADSSLEYYEKLSKRALSSLLSISDEAFEAGLKRLKAWAAAQPPSAPVCEPLDLFVFQKA